jgi:predicted peptidase
MPVRQSVRRFKTRSLTLDYLVHVPPHADGAPPLVLFLHGAGERGWAPERIVTHGIAKVVEHYPTFPFVAISPQCPPGRWWVQFTGVLHDLAAHTAAELGADQNRLYLTGLSMGGFGVWKMAAEHPERYAAIVPICGGGDPRWAPKLRGVPTWAFHGVDDPIVPVQETISMVEALEALEANVRMSLYPGVGHDSWTRTYDNPALYDWLASLRLSR